MARTDSSDSEGDEIGKDSPLLARKRRAKSKRRHNSAGDKTTSSTETTNEISEELAYMDTLPEDVKLVEVNSNIWGTKFKIHGIAKNLPANLGHISYKTSLLHLQPRQMTVVVTELRDDVHNDPDPNFNPHIFSEDEDEPLILIGAASKMSNIQSESNAITSVAPMSPIVMRPRSGKAGQIGGNTTSTGPKSSMLGPLAKAESYEDELPACEKMSEIQKSIRPKNIEQTASSSGRAGPSYSSLVTQYSRSSSNSSGQSRHAISPLCCEGSVPTLQSPKNAVAPSDIIFDRPPASGGHASLMSFSGNSDCSGNTVQVKSSVFSGESVKSSAQPVVTAKRRDLQYIDEDNVTHATIENSAISRTPTIISISPASITRSCSVGYLDSVDIIPSDITLSILRKETPYKRLVLVDRKPTARKDKRINKKKLVQCGKSKSLDSCDMQQIFAKVEKTDALMMPKVHETSETDDSLSDVVAEGDSGDETQLIAKTTGALQKQFGASKQHSKNMCFKCRFVVKECACKSVKRGANNGKLAVANTSVASGSPSKKAITSDKATRKKMSKSEIITSYADSPIFTRKHRFGDNGSETSSANGKKTDYSFSFLKQLSESRRRKRDESLQNAKAEREVHQQIEMGDERSNNISLHSQVNNLLLPFK